MNKLKNTNEYWKDNFAVYRYFNQNSKRSWSLCFTSLKEESRAIGDRLDAILLSY